MDELRSRIFVSKINKSYPRIRRYSSKWITKTLFFGLLGFLFSSQLTAMMGLDTQAV